MQTVLITGGTGFIGKALSQSLLQKGYAVIILSREAGKKAGPDGISYAVWNIAGQTIDRDAIVKADYIIHLAGAGVADQRWTKKRKQEIVDSRVNSGKLIVDSLRSIPNKVKAVISASGIGWYGEDELAAPNTSQTDPRKFVEQDPPAADFLGETCKKWEASIAPLKEIGKRVVTLRTGIVLGKEGGALKEFLRPLKFGVAAILGSGKQVISWIQMDDLVKMYIAAIENDTMEGVYNAVSPHPVTNKELTIQLAKSRKRFYIPIHVPAFMLKMILGEMSIEILKSATVSAEKISSTGFQFDFPDINSAFR